MSRKRSRKPQTSQSSKPLVNVVMPFYGEIDFVKRAVSHVSEACGSVPYELILVDNGTPNGAGAKLFKELRGQYKFKQIQLKVNQGYPGGVNVGVYAGSAPLIFIWTADVIMDPGSIEAAVKEMDDPDVGVVGAKLVFPEGSPHGPPGHIQHAGLAMNLSGDIFHIFIGWSSDNPRVNKRREMFAVTGAAFMTRRQIFMQIGGMNTVYGKGTYEDVEFCCHVRRAGKKVLWVPEISGTHYVGGSIKAGENGEGFALGPNRDLFRARMSWAFEWDEWRYW